MTRWVLITILFGLLPAGSTAGENDPDSTLWDGRIDVYGALKAMFHEGQTQAMVTLDSMLPDPDLYAVGALAGLSGEVTIVGGEVVLSYPGNAGSAHTETTSHSDAGATLLVAASVSAWRDFRIDEPIAFDELDERIAALALGAGLASYDRFPFLLEGEFEDLRWHVIDGRKLTAGGGSHQDHLKASVQEWAEQTSATLLGFYSVRDQGVFTHMGSRTHVHCVLEEPLAGGHVDHVAIPAGTTVRFPAVKSADALPRALSLAEEVERLAGLRTLWPGFDPLIIPLAVYDGDATYLFRHPAPPEGFRAVRRAGREVHTHPGRHPAVTANTSADIGGVSTATVMFDRSDPDLDLTDLAAVALHEAFHVYQQQEHPEWQANEGDLFVYPVDEDRLLAWRRLETDALRRAIDAADSTESACWARQVLALRSQRFAEMETAFSSYERKTELYEGIATHVERSAGGHETVEFPAGGFDATEVRRRAYSTGSAFALLLDRFDPGWPVTFGALDPGSLDQALQTVLGTDPLRCTHSESEITEAGRTARDDVEAVLAEQGEQRAAFEMRPGWRVTVRAAEGAPLWPHGFDPLNVTRIPGGILHSRFVRLGNESGELEAIDSQEIDLESMTEAAGRHPLFEGIRRVEIAGLARPSVSVEGETVRLQAPGFTASFHGATLDESSTELVIALQPVE